LRCRPNLIFADVGKFKNIFCPNTKNKVVAENIKLKFHTIDRKEIWVLYLRYCDRVFR
jgi:hypothetical protein